MIIVISICDLNRQLFHNKICSSKSGVALDSNFVGLLSQKTWICIETRVLSLSGPQRSSYTDRAILTVTTWYLFINYGLYFFVVIVDICTIQTQPANRHLDPPEHRSCFLQATCTHTLLLALTLYPKCSFVIKQQSLLSATSFLSVQLMVPYLSSSS